ncbi:MAG: hypothetical protein IAE87_16790 [Rhodobacteraceae bacterium]|jgi:hypothetical protein|nr:hypothetical protein [Paracoccaceae bacterium]
MLRALLALACVSTLAACGADRTWAPDDQIAAARYVAGPPPSITLFTVINDRNGSGAHSGLMINGSERILFDPAGTFEMPRTPIRNDVHFGISDRVLAFYRDYHARDSETEKFHIVERTVIVSPEVAQIAMQRALDYGAVPKAFCANSISAILRGVPGFEAMPSTMFPIKLGDAFGTLPGVQTQIITEENDNPGLGHGVVMVDKKGNRIN